MLYPAYASKSIKLVFTILLSGFLFIMPISQIKAQRNAPVQSTFHDAIALYYALKNYKVIPILMTDEEASAASEENATAIYNNIKLVKYKIVESATGKVITENIDSSKLDSALNSNPELFEFKDDERRAFTNTILARNAGTDDTSQATIDALYKKNSYLFDDTNNIKNTITTSFLSQASNFQKLEGSNPVFSKSGGALSLTTKIAEGTVEFLIEAVNKEINEAFFVQMQKILSKIDELKILFPKTLESLTKVTVTEYASSLNALKAAFKEDIDNLLSNISNLATLKKYRDIINNHPALTLLFAACDFIYLLRTDAIPAEIIYQVGTAPYIQKCKNNNYSSSIKLATLISNSLRNIRAYDENKDKIGWIDRACLNELRDDSSLFRIFMGLFAQQAKGIVFDAGEKDEFDFQATLFKEKPNVLDGHFIVYNFTTTVKNINDRLASIENLKKNSAKASKFAEVYLAIANDIISLSDNCISVLPSTKEVNKVRDKIRKVKGEYLPMLTQANKVVASIEEKEYSMALYQADTLLSKIFDNTNTNKLKDSCNKIKDSLKTAQKAKTEDTNLISTLKNSLQDINEQIDSSSKFEEIRKYYIKYGLFISSVATAKTSADVKEAIKAIALPTGSSRIKKTYNWSFGLNAYVGLYHAWNKEYKNIKLPNEENGITVPIGFALSGGHFLGGSLSIYGGIVDLGAIFTYKVNTDSTLKSDIQFSQLLSPSIGLIYGLPIINKFNIPLSIGANYQWGPKLKKVNDNGNSVLPLLTQRFNIFIAVDLPIVNFHVSKN